MRIQDTKSSKKHNLSTTVFIIDDDPALLNRVRRESLRDTNLGVLTAADLPTAVKLLNEDFPVGAILVDLHFRPETWDKKNNIHDGIELLDYANKIKPNLPFYVISMDAPDRTFHQGAKEKGLNIREWYDKLKSQSQGGQFSPWVRIERDLILQAIKSEPEFRNEAVKESGESVADLLRDEDVAEKVQTVFNYPRLTYLQDLPVGCGYHITNPIEVLCWPYEHYYKATAKRIPLLIDAEGEKPDEALENLAEILIQEYSHSVENATLLSGYAQYIMEQLDIYLEPLPKT